MLSSVCDPMMPSSKVENDEVIELELSGKNVDVDEVKEGRLSQYSMEGKIGVGT